MKKKFLIVILTIISLLTCLNAYTPLEVKADSGFDSSYDSGGWDSGSDWGSDSSWSSSDWDSDSSSSYGNYSGSFTFGDFIILMFFIIIITFIIMRASKMGNYNGISANPIKLDHTKELDDDKVKEIIKDFDKETFLKERYNDYLKVQEDWMNFNYDGLRDELTDELYNQYEMQLDTLKVKNQKNIMRNFIYDDSMITGIKKENKQITIIMELAVSFVDYIEQDGNIVRGNDRILINQHYELTFVLSETNIDNCPNCGAKITKKSSQKCEYCGSIISRVGNKAVLSKKESLRQR